MTDDSVLMRPAPAAISALLFDFEASLRLVDRAIVELLPDDDSLAHTTPIHLSPCPTLSTQRQRRIPSSLAAPLA